MEILAPGTPYGGGAAAAFVTPDAVEDGDCCDLCATLPERQRNMRFRSHDHTPAWVQFEECEKWLHQVCDRIIDPALQERLEKSDVPYICRSCTRKRTSPDIRARTLHVTPKEKRTPRYRQRKSTVHRRVSWLQKRLGKPPCPCTPAYLTYYARVCLLGLGCEYGMAPIYHPQPELPSSVWFKI